MRLSYFLILPVALLQACSLLAHREVPAPEISPEDAAKMSLERRLEKASWVEPIALPVGSATDCEKLVFQEGRGGTNLRWVCENGDLVADFTLTAELRKSRGASAFYKKTWAARGAFGVAPARGNEKPGLYRVDLVSGVRKLIAPGTGLKDPALSPSGQLLIYSSPKGLRAVAAKGGEIVALSQNPDDRAPIFREDGKRLTWVRGGRKFQLWGADVTDLGPESAGLHFENANLLAPLMFESFGGWTWVSGSDQILASLAAAGGKRALHLVGPGPINGFCLKRLTQVSEEELLPAASPSGKYVAWKRGTSIYVAPFTIPAAPCDGSAIAKTERR